MPRTSAVSPPTPSSRPRPRGRHRAWIPDQHGAWAMLVLPFAAGVWLTGPDLAHVPLFGLWLVGYLAYAALGRWLRSRRRTRSARPMLVLGGLCVPFGVATLAAAPELLRWVPVYLPLVALSLALTATGRERSLGNDAVTVLAASLMAAVSSDAGVGVDWPTPSLVAAVLLTYFLGTVLYVKTMIRERGRAGYVAASVGFHLTAVAAATWLAATGLQTWALPVVAALLTARAAAGPFVNARRPRPLRPAVVGVGEIVASLAVTLVAQAGVT
jgi:hypothetical protein